MLNHYFEVKVNENLHPAGFFGRIIHRIHGYSVTTNSAGVAVDFPEWKAHKGMMSAGTGNVLRVLGSKEKLSGLLLNTGLMQFLLEGGVSITGITPIPQDVKCAVLRRNNKISKYSKLLQNPGDICGISHDPGQATSADLEAAHRFNVSAEVAMAANVLMGKKIKEEKTSALLRVPSVSKGRPFDLYLTRSEGDGTCGGEFSTYGLSLNGAKVPCW